MTHPNDLKEGRWISSNRHTESTIVKSLLSRFIEDECGAIEYGLIAAGIAVLIIVAVAGKLVSFVP